jgi:hypothetical protein
LKSLLITKAKPNLAGKDRSAHIILPRPLSAEWVDFQNSGSETFNMNGISLHHIAYQPVCRNGKWEDVMSFQGELASGKSVGIHSGGKIPLSDMNIEDVIRVDVHLFTGKNYIWNNNCGDSIGLWNGNNWVDKAAYDPYPQEGAILTRVGDRLVTLEIRTNFTYRR